MNSKRISRLKNRCTGFTLIELLVVISIIAILAGVLLPVFQRSLISARRIKGIANLRTAGAAVMAYAGENNGILPGPCALGVVPTVNSKAKSNGDLAGFIAPYLGFPDVSKMGGYVIVPALTSPGMAALSQSYMQPSSRIPHYIQSDVLKGITATGGSGTVRPFGGTIEPVSEPVRLLRLGDFTDLSGKALSSVQVWLLTDVDQQSNDPQAKASGWFTSLPKTPVYVSNRLRIYADGHAAAAPLDEQ